MMTEILSPYQLLDVEIFESVVFVNVDMLEHPLSDDRPLTIQQQFILHNSNENDMVCEVQLFIDYKVYHEKIKGSRKKSESVVDLHVALRGLVGVQFEDSVGEEEKNYLLQVNAISLLYAEARSHLVAVTALSPVGKVILPPINPYAFVESSLKTE